jgi:adenylate cyclase
MGQELASLGHSLTGERMERRLAAVLAMDVAGYSRLMGFDEEGTLARLKAVRKALVDPTIASHRGRIVKTTGDGVLIEFASAVDAVRGAVEVQRVMAEQNASVPQDERIDIRQYEQMGAGRAIESISRWDGSVYREARRRSAN